MRRGTRTWIGGLAAAAAVVGVWRWSDGHRSGEPVSAPSGGCATTTAPPPSSTVITTTTVAASSTTTVTGPALREGATGPAVVALQERLVALGFWVGDTDGVFGASTSHAVVAFEKAHDLPRDGVVATSTLAAIARGSRLVARSTTGRVIEVDLEHQLLLVAYGGQVDWVMDACTGAVPGSTPTGHFRVFRQVDGYDRGPLGVLYRPKYFTNGVAVHGYPVVPPVPSSHGCVRVTNAAMDYIWSHDLMPIGTAVWVY